MSAHELLIRHALNWASSKHRELDPDLLATVLDLRSDYDEAPAMAWPTGSAEHLLLVRWPAQPPQIELDTTALQQTLDTFWRFLRATGRMSRDSAAPAALVKEASKALPRMGAADDDRKNWSQGRVLTEFGRSIGIDLEMSQDTDEAQRKLSQIQAAWNSLPQSERLRLMPDPTPKSVAGQRFTDLINQSIQPNYPADADDSFGPDELRRGDPAVAAQQVRDSEFVNACLRLAEWVGPRREVTSIGVLRPKFAREAYDAVDVFAWERLHDRTYRDVDLPPEAWEVMATNARDYWTSAGDCIGLDRLWYACESAGLVRISTTVAQRGNRPPDDDSDWLMLGLTLVFALVSRFDQDRVHPLIGILLMGAVLEDGLVPVDAVKEWWRARRGFDQLVAARGLEDAEFYGQLYDGMVDFVLDMFDDTGLWVCDGDGLEVTDFGLELGVVLSNAWEDGDDDLA